MKKEAKSKKESKEMKGANLKSYLSFSILLFPITFLIILRREVIKPRSVMDFTFVLLFLIILVALIYLLLVKKIINNIIIRKKGEKVKADVIGYHDDNSSFGDEYSKIIELSIKTSTGDEIICFSTTEKYDVGSEIELIIYNDSVLINNEKINKTERIHNILFFTLMSIIACLYISDIIVYKLFNTTYYDIKMSIILNNNKEILTGYNNLKYKIPNDYKLSTYSRDSEYSFASQNDKHNCNISIYLFDSEKYKNKINKCQYYDEYNKYINDEEIIINDSKWCYSTLADCCVNYYYNDGKNYYSIVLRRYDDRDEKCSLDFDNFVNSINVNK